MNAPMRRRTFLGGLAALFAVHHLPRVPVDPLNAQLQALTRALEAGSYRSALVPGHALQVEDLSAVMANVTFNSTRLRLRHDI